MAAFKDVFDEALVRRMGAAIAGAIPSFDEAGFVADVVPHLEALELKGRVAAIADSIVARAGVGFDALVEALIGLLAPARPWQDGLSEGDGEGWRGMRVWPWMAVIERHGLDAPEVSLDAMEVMTSRMSAEFAVRPFLVRWPERTLERVARWARSADDHVRRLASEGTRPRLPWGMRLDAFVADPSPMLPVLDTLVDDPAEYVRRSVANHLNDISKDHPDLAVEVAARWASVPSEARRRVVRHGLRTLVKQGHEGALALLGFDTEARVEAMRFVCSPKVAIGGALEFSCELRSRDEVARSLVVDYRVHHVLADGSRSPKVFKLRTVELGPRGSIAVKKRHPMKPVTTRTLRPGTHRVELVVNGSVLAGAEFELTDPA